jgi:hypothetical protein
VCPKCTIFRILNYFILHKNSIVMKNLFLKICACIAFTSFFAMQSCDKHSDVVSSINQIALDTAEINIQDQWKCTNENLPSTYLKNKFEELNLSFKESDSSFHWIWKEKSGFIHDYKGKFTHTLSTYKNYNLQAIWNIEMKISSYNGTAAIGGWKGIYSSSVDAKTLILNIEEDNFKTQKFPQDHEGIGSGESGYSAVYPFKKQP